MADTFDCLVVGSGIAGLSAALALAERGKRVLVVTAAPEVVRSNTGMAQGGIVYKASETDEAQLRSDILEAGGQANYVLAVEQLGRLGPKLVKEVLLEKASVPFDRNGDDLALTREAAHGASRILHSGDQSGFSIESSLYEYCRRIPEITFKTGFTAVNLLMTSFHARSASDRFGHARCIGAFLFDQASGEVVPQVAPHTILATGGVGQLFLHNTNSHFARGDGIALAHRAGCRLMDLELVQFHPTTFFGTDAPRFLISEALRGEGGVLLDGRGERFLRRYIGDVEIPELAPRDKVAWAINQHMVSSGEPCAYLDVSHKDGDWLKERFPFIYENCLRYGVDLTQSPIPVVPGAHYHLGGIWVDLQGRSSIPGLWAAGEVACTGLHGVNRLASTSLLEGLVWGNRAGHAIADGLNRPWNCPELEPWQAESEDVEPGFLKQDWLTLKHTMWNYVGLIKTNARLQRAEGILRELVNGVESFYQKASLSDALLGLRHGSRVAWLILQACKKNRRSQGCYFFEKREI